MKPMPALSNLEASMDSTAKIQCLAIFPHPVNGRYSLAILFFPQADFPSIAPRNDTPQPRIHLRRMRVNVTRRPFSPGQNDLFFAPFKMENFQ
jgi:hypothetical protein